MGGITNKPNCKLEYLAIASRDRLAIFFVATPLAGDAAEGFVEGDDGEVDVLFALGDGVFGLELGAFGVEEIEEVGDAFAVAEAGDVGVAFAFLGLNVEFDEAFLLGAEVGEGVFGFFQRAQDGVFVRNCGFVGDGGGAADAGSGAADVEGGPAYVACGGGGEGPSGEEEAAASS